MSPLFTPTCILSAAECSSDDDTSWLLVPPHDKKHKSPLKWKNVALFVCLWVAYLLCNMAIRVEVDIINFMQ